MYNRLFLYQKGQTVKEKKIGPATVRLLQGNLTSCEVDAVINVTGKTLVPHDADEKLQPQILDSSIWDNSPEDEIPVAMTPAEQLRAQHILNAPIVDTTPTAGAHKIRKTMRHLLEEAQAQKLHSLALPPIGAGINRYPLERCAEILLEELARSVSRDDNSLQKVIFVLETQKGYRIFEQVLEQFEQDMQNHD